MMNFKALLSKIRAKVVTTLFPAKGYWVATKTVKPISAVFGYDRGTPIDRFWIENFLEENKALVKGHVLEVTDNAYTQKYDNGNVTQSDVLDIDVNNKKATIHGDLRNLKAVIKDNTFDCIIMTHVLGLIDDIDAAIAECHRILKPGGVILATSSCLSPTYDTKSNFWRFTPNGASYLFKKVFRDQDLTVTAYGNALTGQCFWVGMAQEDLTQEELMYNDPKYPCVVSIKAFKEVK